MQEANVEAKHLHWLLALPTFRQLMLNKLICQPLQHAASDRNSRRGCCHTLFSLFTLFLWWPCVCICWTLVNVISCDPCSDLWRVCARVCENFVNFKLKPTLRVARVEAQCNCTPPVQPSTRPSHLSASSHIPLWRLSVAWLGFAYSLRQLARNLEHENASCIEVHLCYSLKHGCSQLLAWTCSTCNFQLPAAICQLQRQSSDVKRLRCGWDLLSLAALSIRYLCACNVKRSKLSSFAASRTHH